jgi:antitoxin VapB
MALSIKDPEADRLARELASRTGETLTEAVTCALRERLERHRARRATPRLSDELRRIGERCSALPVLDDRSPDDIVGYDGRGVPGRW